MLMWWCPKWCWGTMEWFRKNMENYTNYIKSEYYHFLFMIQKSKKSCPCKRHLVHTCCKTGTPLPRTKGENLPVADRAIRNPQDNNSVIAFKGAFREFLWQRISTDRYQKHQELQIVDDLDSWTFCSRSRLEEHFLKSKFLVYREIWWKPCPIFAVVLKQGPSSSDTNTIVANSGACRNRKATGKNHRWSKVAPQSSSQSTAHKMGTQTTWTILGCLEFRRAIPSTKNGCQTLPNPINKELAAAWSWETDCIYDLYIYL